MVFNNLKDKSFSWDDLVKAIGVLEGSSNKKDIEMVEKLEEMYCLD